MRYVQTIELRSRLQQFLRAGSSSTPTRRGELAPLAAALYSITDTLANSSGQLAPRDSTP